MEDLYREVILDHYKNPRGHGVIEDADAQAEGLNPLCGDEVTIYVQFGEDGETVDEVKFSGRGCAISQASTSMLMEMVQGRTATEIAELPKEDLLEEVGIPLTPVRLKCALLGLGRAEGRAAPREGDAAARRNGPGSTSSTSNSALADIVVAPVEELPPGTVKIVHAGEISVGVYNLNGRYCAIEDRCSHDDGPLCEGEFELDEGVAICPRHGARIEICTGRPLSLPAVLPVETFPVRVEDGLVKVTIV